MVELKPFTRLYTFYPYDDKKLRDMVSRVSKALHYAEYETVRRGYRKATTWHIYTVNYDMEVGRIFRDDLVWVPMLRSKVYEGFSHKHFTAKDIGLDTFTFGALARTLEDAEELVKAHEGNVDHKAIGKILGYPDCCTDFFCKVWAKGIYDPMYEIAMNTEDKEVKGDEVVVYGHPFLNQLTRYVGLRVTPWFPCSFKCKESVRLAEEVWAKLMREYDDEAFDFYVELVKEGIRWDSLYGIAEVTIGDKLKIVTNTYPRNERRVVVYKVR